MRKPRSCLTLPSSPTRVESLSDHDYERPPFAPDLAVEVRSPDDRRSTIARKTELYLEYGAITVLDVDPATLAVRVTTPEGTVTLGRGQTFSHPAFPGLALEVDALFAPRARRKM